MTCKTGPCGVNIFKTATLRDRSANVDETWRVYSAGRGTKRLGSGILNYDPCVARGRRHPKLGPVGRDNPLRPAC